MKPILFKVLIAGEPCHGGTGAYPPVGEWTPSVTPSCCSSGYHLTTDPLAWWKPNAELWIAEPDGAIHGDGSPKAAFERVRLIERVTWEWPYLVMFPRLRAFIAASDRSLDASCDISRVNLSGSNLSGADLSGANLSGANLSYAGLSYANLSCVNLSGANLSGADLSGANLSGADLSYAYCPINTPSGWVVDDDGRLKMA